MTTILPDLRHSARSLLRSPGFTAVAVLILALAIGLNTAVFSLVNSMLPRPRPGADQPGEVVGLFCYDTITARLVPRVLVPDLPGHPRAEPGLQRRHGRRRRLVGIGEGELTRRVFAFSSAANYFSTFGVQPALGRAFSAGGGSVRGQRQVVILSDDYWRKRARPGVLGTTLRINTRSTSPSWAWRRAGFAGPSALISPAVYLPLGVYDRPWRATCSARATTPTGRSRERRHCCCSAD